MFDYFSENYRKEETYENHLIIKLVLVSIFHILILKYIFSININYDLILSASEIGGNIVRQISGLYFNSRNLSGCATYILFLPLEV